MGIQFCLKTTTSLLIVNNPMYIFLMHGHYLEELPHDLRHGLDGLGLGLLLPQEQVELLRTHTSQRGITVFITLQATALRKGYRNRSLRSDQSAVSVSFSTKGRTRWPRILLLVVHIIVNISNSSHVSSQICRYTAEGGLQLVKATYKWKLDRMSLQCSTRGKIYYMYFFVGSGKK